MQKHCCAVPGPIINPAIVLFDYTERKHYPVVGEAFSNEIRVTLYSMEFENIKRLHVWLIYYAGCNKIMILAEAGGDATLAASSASTS